MNKTEIIELSIAEGFHGAEIISTDKIVFDAAFRHYCEENLCGQYGVNYSCPPDCGTPEQMKQKVLTHKKPWSSAPSGRSRIFPRLIN